jgi:hypothetical protein
MAPEDVGNTPAYWIRPTRVLSAALGFHRFVWDLHYAPPAGTSSQPGEYPISATPHDTPREPRGPWVVPGQVTVRLTAGGKSYTEPLTIVMDPRVKTPPVAIAAEHATAMRLFDDVARDSAVMAQGAALRARLADATTRANGNSAATSAIDAFGQSLAALTGQGGARGRRGGRGRGGAGGATFASIDGQLLSMMALLEEADAAPTDEASDAVRGVERDFAGLTNRWTALRTTELASLNAKLRVAGQSPVTIAP